MIVIADKTATPDSPVLGVDVLPGFRVEIGHKTEIEWKLRKKLACLGVKTSIGDIFYPVGVYIGDRSLPGFFFPGIGTHWLGKNEDRNFAFELDHRIAPGGDLHEYHQAIDALVAVREGVAA